MVWVWPEHSKVTGSNLSYYDDNLPAFLDANNMKIKRGKRVKYYMLPNIGFGNVNLANS